MAVFTPLSWRFLPLVLSLVSAWKPMKSRWKLLLYGKELARSHQDHCTKVTSLTLRFTALIGRVMESVLEPTWYLDFAVFGSTVKSAVTRRGVSYLRCLVVGVERLKEGSRLLLADGRYYSIHLLYFIAFSWSSLLSGLAVFALCYFVYWHLPFSLVFRRLCCQSDGRLRNPICLLNRFADCVLVM